ncbi:CopD family protein [Devosia sp. XJ19-1]|uniref:Protoporphyrinogen IX oxidase n=1 Tax=Devosia ureilytica TaxID=2952754 RepID=A0A9Q4APP6_9HYPH|nr:CopD family protein [Devosia ureilytica]MCP8884456.1 CopD family protein [Devosia ureilytica]MCP8888064.1 CopD family protein [Devosia ureilytica]
MIVLWLKFVHVAAIAGWSAGLVALPMLYLQRAGLEGEPLHRLHAFTRFLYVVMVSPVAFIAIGSGTALIFMQGTYENWFSAKLVGVSVMTGVHIFSGLMILRLFEPGKAYPLGRFVVVMALTLGAIAAILALVLGKPDMEWPAVLAALFAPGALSDLVDQFIGGTK